MKKSNFRASSVVAVALMLATPATFATDVYKVEATVSHAEQTIGAPVFRVNRHSPASVAVSGDSGYELSVQLMPDEDEDALEVSIRLATSEGSVSTVVTTRLDRPISVASGDIGLRLTVSRDDS